MTGATDFAGGDIETVRAFLDLRVTFEEGESALDTPATYHAPDGRYQSERFIAAGDRVLVEVRRTGRGSSSRAPVERRQFHVCDVTLRASRSEASAETAAAP